MEVAVSNRTLGKLRRIAERTGRSVEEIAAEAADAGARRIRKQEQDESTARDKAKQPGPACTQATL